MSSLLLGTLAGVLFGIIAVLLMIPLTFGNKRTAMIGAFVNRFSIGFVIGAAPHLFSFPAWISGLLFGLLLSLADAIITKSYIPLLVLGALGGLLIGLAVGVWAV
jgi:hypothetical protein